MTETEWFACTDPQPMLAFLRGKVSDRKLRLFACACCRRIWHVITDSRHAVELAERYADGQASLAELEDAREEAELIWSDPEFGEDVARQHSFRGYSTLWCSDDDAAEVTQYCVQMAAEAAARPNDLDNPERAVQCDLLRCIFRNPFRPMTIDQSWQTGTVVFLAQAIYADRAFDRMGILADALEESGCTNPDILSHCRGPGPHTRGCWVVDLILGKK